MDKAVIYARRSTDKQKETSNEAQLQVCYAYAKQHGYEVVDEYIDRGFSAKSDNRPRFLDMIKDSNKKEFQYVITYQFDRFARDRYDSAIYKKRLKNNGVRVLSAKENISDDASGIMLEALLEAMAEHYSVELGQKVKRNMLLNAQNGFHNGGPTPLGYYVHKTVINEQLTEKRLKVDEEQRPLVIQIFEMYRNGKTQKEICDYLNNKGIRTSTGAEFNRSSLGKILAKKLYIGILKFDGIEFPNESLRIVSDELFYDVQDTLTKNRKSPATRKAYIENILATKLYCGFCGSVMVGSSTKKPKTTYYYYKCKQGCKHNMFGGKRTVDKKWIEDFVIEEILKILTPENINIIAKDVVEFANKEIEDDSSLKNLKKQIAKNEKEIKNLTRAIAKGAGSAVDVIMKDINEKIERNRELEKQILLETRKYPELTVSYVKFFLSRFANGDKNDIEFRKDVINTFILKITLTDKKTTILFTVQDGLEKSLDNIPVVTRRRVELLTSP